MCILNLVVESLVRSFLALLGTRNSFVCFLQLWVSLRLIFHALSGRQSPRPLSSWTASLRASECCSFCLQANAQSSSSSAGHCFGALTPESGLATTRIAARGPSAEAGYFRAGPSLAGRTRL